MLNNTIRDDFIGDFNDLYISRYLYDIIREQNEYSNISVTLVRWIIKRDLTISFVFLTSFISGVIVSVLASSAVDCGFESRSGQTKDYKISICCFSTKQTALRRKSKDWLAWNQNNVSQSGKMSTHRLLFQWASTIKIQQSVFV